MKINERIKDLRRNNFNINLNRHRIFHVSTPTQLLFWAWDAVLEFTLTLSVCGLNPHFNDSLVINQDENYRGSYTFSSVKSIAILDGYRGWRIMSNIHVFKWRYQLSGRLLSITTTKRLIIVKYFGVDFSYDYIPTTSSRTRTKTGTQTKSMITTTHPRVPKLDSDRLNHHL